MEYLIGSEDAISAESLGSENLFKSKYLKCHVLVVVLYLAASCLVFNSILVHGLPTAQPKIGSGDFGLSVLNIAWLPFAVLHGENIFYSNYQFALRGINMMGTPAYFTQALVMSPITLLFGPMVSTNLAIILGPVVTAYTSFLVYLKITKNRFGSFLAGLVLGLSILVVNDSIYGHFHVTWIFGPPIIFYIYYRIMTRSDISILKSGFWLGVVCTLQFYASTELITTTLFFYAIFGVILYFLDHGLIKTRIKEVIMVTVIGGVISLLCCGYAIYFFLFGKDHVFFDNGTYSNPVFKLGITDLFIPLNKLNLGLDPFSNNFSKVAVPITILVTSAVFIKYLWRRKISRFSLIFCIFIYFSMIGPELKIFPMENLLPNPVYYLLMHVPIISSTLFVRFIYYFIFFLNFGFIVAMQKLEMISRGQRSKFKKILSAKYLVAVLLAINLFWMDSHFFSNQQNIAPGGILASGKYIPQGSIISVYPRATISNGDPLIYLAQSNFHYRLTSGYGFESIRGIPTFYLRLSPIDNYLYFQTAAKILFQPNATEINRLKMYVSNNNLSCIVVTNRQKNSKIVEAIVLIFGKEQVVGHDALWCNLKT